MSSTDKDILIIDNDKYRISKLKNILKNEAYNLTIHQDFEQVIPIVNKVKPALIIISGKVAKVDSFSLCKQLRTNKSTQSIPALMILSSTKRTDHKKAFDHLASDYIFHPFEKKEVLSRIGLQLKAQSSDQPSQSQSTQLAKELQEERKTTFEQVRLLQDAKETIQKLEEEKQALQLQFQKFSTMDEITYLPKRSAFFDFFSKEWKRSIRREEALSLLVIDTDHYAEIAQHHGLEFAHQCLSQIAQAITKHLMRPGDFPAHYVDGRFVILLPSTDLLGSVTVADSIRIKIQELNIQNHHIGEGYLTVSIGVASLTPTRDHAPEDLVTRAEDALQKALERGKNRVEAAMSL